MGLFRSKKKPGGAPPPTYAQTLSELQDRGADLANVRLIRHYLYGRDEHSLAPAVAELNQGGYKVHLGPTSKGDGWLAFAEKEEVVDAQSLAASRLLFERLALETPGGTYDGWEAVVTEV